MRDLRRRSWSWFLRTMVLPMGDLAFRQRMMKRLFFLEEAQWWEPDRIDRYRNRLLTFLIEVAYSEVPFYRMLMDKNGLKPSDIKCVSHINKLPIVTKAMLRDAYPHLVVRNTGQKTYEAFTSGSTGKNFCVREDPETSGWYRASFLLALQWAGWHIGERHVQTGMTTNRTIDRRLKDYLLRCHYVSAYDLTDASLDQTLNLLEVYSIKHLWGYPGSLFFLAQRALEKGWNRPLRSIVTWGDKVFPNYRKTIESAFKIGVHDTYGCAEGMQIAAQCESMNGYHLHALDIVLESLDDSGFPASSDKPGNLIVTRLHPGPMPLIRYKIGDLGIIGNESSCVCGRGLPMMKSILGRDTDVIITPDGNRLIVHFFTGILEHFTQIDSFQVVQDSCDSIIVRMVPAKGSSDDLSTAIKDKLKEMGARNMRIEVEVVDNIPLSSGGKRRFVINEAFKRRSNTSGLNE